MNSRNVVASANSGSRIETLSNMASHLDPGCLTLVKNIHNALREWAKSNGELDQSVVNAQQLFCSQWLQVLYRNKVSEIPTRLLVCHDAIKKAGRNDVYMTSSGKTRLTEGQKEQAMNRRI